MEYNLQIVKCRWTWRVLVDFRSPLIIGFFGPFPTMRRYHGTFGPLDWSDRSLQGTEPMQTFQVTDLLPKVKQSHRPWLEFLRVASLSMGIYHLKAGQPDPQQPHSEDEVYYVVSGRASFRAGSEQLGVGPGALIYVERSVEHRFFDVTEDLTVLVFFAPPEGS